MPQAEVTNRVTEILKMRISRRTAGPSHRVKRARRRKLRRAAPEVGSDP